MECIKCRSGAVKNGYAKGLQRWKCKSCGYQFTKMGARGRPVKEKVAALVLYLSGMSMNMTAQIVGVSTQTVMRWIKAFGETYGQLPAPDGKPTEVEIDEMWHYIKKNGRKSGYGKYIAVVPKDSLPGIAAIVISTG